MGLYGLGFTMQKLLVFGFAPVLGLRIWVKGLTIEGLGAWGFYGGLSPGVEI